MKEAYSWIKKAISTSKSEFHLEGCWLLIELFANKYKEENGQEGGQPFRDMYNELIIALTEKQTFLCVEV